MADWFDVLEVALVVIFMIWGAAAGAYRPLCLALALLVGIGVGARYSGPIADILNRLGTNPGITMVQAVSFVLVLIVATLIAFGLLSAMLAFMKPTTRAAQELISSRLFGAISGLLLGVLLSATVLMTTYLAASGQVAQNVPALANVQPSLDRASLTPAMWRLIHFMGDLGTPLIGRNTPPFTQP